MPSRKGNAVIEMELSQAAGRAQSLGRGWGIVILWVLGGVGVLASACLIASAGAAEAQEAAGLGQAGAEQAKPDGGEADIALDFPENVELKVLIEFVSKRLGLNMVYDDKVAAKRVTLRSPAKVPPAALLPLLESVLRMNGLAMVEEEATGFRRIVQAGKLTEVAGFTEHAKTAASASPATAVTQVFQLKHADPVDVEQLLRNFLTPQSAGALSLKDRGLLIVTDYASNLGRIEDLIKLADQPARKATVKFHPVRDVDAGALATQVRQLLIARQQAEGRAAAAPAVQLTEDARTNQVILIGEERAVAEAQTLLTSLDVPLGLETRIYALRHIPPQRIDTLARELVGEQRGGKVLKTAIDRDANLLVVTTTPDGHETVAQLQRDLDKPAEAQQSRLRFYELANTTAGEVLAVIQSMAGTPEGLATLAEVGAPPKPQSEPKPDPASLADPRSPLKGVDVQGPLRGGQGSVQTKDAQVIADPNTNTIIVMAEPAIQTVYEQLIRRLDRRRPQVLIEITVVTIDTSDDFSLGVEISGVTEDSDGDPRGITFSSFGLSRVDPGTGRLTLSPGLGFNGALVSADIADVVVKALKAHGRARVVSAPKVLVNDNATGSLSSIAEAPFTSINASDTVATTSFAGFASAGTTISVTPHISEGNHLQLDYSIELNAFTGSGSETLPPPRQTNSVQSKVTIPDGHTIIVGGLTRQDTSQTKAALPWLGDIPWVEYLFSSRSASDKRTTLFMFIRPVILRDDAFLDLKFLSGREQQRAGLPGDYPASEPLLMD